MSIDAKSALIGGGVAVAGLVLLGKSKTKKSGTKKSRKGLGATYLVSGKATRLVKRAAAVHKAANGGSVRATKRKK